MSANRESVFFLVRADRALKDPTQELVIKLHDWPKKLDAYMAVCEERHEEEKKALESQIAQQRAEFLAEMRTWERAAREVASWGDPQTWWHQNPKLRGF